MKLKTTLLTSIALFSVAAVAFAGPHGHKMFERMDTNNDGKVTAAEMKSAAKQMITEADTDGDKAATPEEFRAHFQAKRQEHLAQRFAEKDTNKDGALSPDEVSKMPEQIFKQLDADGNGTLSQAEFSSHPRGKGHGEGKANKKGKRGKGAHGKGHMKGGMLKQADTNADGKVDITEAETLAGKRFERMDKNQDGVLTKEEATPPRRGHDKANGQDKTGKAERKSDAQHASKGHNGKNHRKDKPSKANDRAQFAKLRGPSAQG